MMKKLFSVLYILLALFASPAAAELIPPYHWTYHALDTIAALADAKLAPASALTDVQAAQITAMAVKRAAADPSKLTNDEFYALQQLASAYKNSFKRAGFEYSVIAREIETIGLASGLSFTENWSLIKKSGRAASAVNNFAFRIYNQLCAEHEEENIIFSPYSLLQAMAMLYEGARGETEREMEQVFSFAPDIDVSIRALNDIINAKRTPALCSSVNGLWLSKRPLVDYRDKITGFYGAEIAQLSNSPERSRKIINQWALKNTNGRIKELIARGVLSRSTSLVLANAVSFKSEWLNKFDGALTSVDTFFLSTGKASAVMMHNNDIDIKYANMGSFEIAEFPYAGNFSLFVLLPSAHTAISEVEKTLSPASIKRWTGAMKTRNAEVCLPKFKHENTFDMAETLQTIGLESAFSDAADFSAITGRRNIFVSNVIHKAFIDVAEEGTEAAAASAVIMMKSTLPPPDKVRFIANRPFIYFIRDNVTQTVMFIGRFVEP